MTFNLKNYKPHEGQIAFHYAVDQMWRFVLLMAGIRGGKTVAGARQAVKEAWNAKGKGVFGIIAPTYNMLDRTTWMEFRDAARPLIAKDNDSKKIIILKNGRAVHGHSAENPDRIRNETFVGFWGDEVREWKDFSEMWKILMGRVLSTNGKGFLTSSPNSYDEVHEVFFEERKKGYGVVHFPTHVNTYIPKEGIDELASNYDTKFMQQELLGEIVNFDGAVYYTFNRTQNAGDLAFQVAQYDPHKPIALCCDFNVDPMAWVLAQMGINSKGLAEVYVIDEIFLRNSNTVECCNEFKLRYPAHNSGLILYGDATGKSRSTNSNVTNWKIIEDELQRYGVTKKVPLSNPAERDRINAVNGLVCNSRGDRRVQINPKCKNLIRDLEQVSYKEGSVQIDKTKDLKLTHPSDAFGYMVDREFSLNRDRFVGLKI